MFLMKLLRGALSFLLQFLYFYPYHFLFFLFFALIFAIFDDHLVRHHLQSDTRCVHGRPGRPLIYAPVDLYAPEQKSPVRPWIL